MALCFKRGLRRQLLVILHRRIPQVELVTGLRLPFNDRTIDLPQFRTNRTNRGLICSPGQIKLPIIPRK